MLQEPIRQRQAPPFGPTRQLSTPFYIRRIARHLAAHAEEPITLDTLASLAAVSPRSIQAGFRAHYGCTPMAFLRDRRLERARQMLMAAPTCNVADVSLACGLRHLGRFSVSYRKRFGETPTETQRRAREGLQTSRS